MMKKVILAFNPKDFFWITRMGRDPIQRIGKDERTKGPILFISIIYDQKKSAPF